MLSGSECSETEAFSTTCAVRIKDCEGWWSGHLVVGLSGRARTGGSR